MNNDLKNYYEVLEIPSTAKSEDVYNSYYRAKSAYSLDSLALYSLMSVEECRNILELIEEAYSILSDPIKRKRYDEARGLNRELSALNYSPAAYRSSIKVDISPFSNTNINYKSENNSPPPAPNLPLGTDFTLNSRADTSSSHIANHHHQQPDESGKALPLSSGTTNINKLVTQVRFALDYAIDPIFEKEIEETIEFTGTMLKKIREYKGVDLERLSDMTKVSKLYLLGIEKEEFEKLPASVYVRGFVYQYAKCLKLKPDIVANSYSARMKKLKP